MKDYIHSDQHGIPCGCTTCKNLLREPAISIASNVTSAGKTEIYSHSWNVKYKLYCSECAFKYLLKKRLRKPRFITKILTKILIGKSEKDLENGTGI